MKKERSTIYLAIRGIIYLAFGIFIGYGFIWDMKIFDKWFLVTLGIMFILYGVLEFLKSILMIIEKYQKKLFNRELKKFMDDEV